MKKLKAGTHLPSYSLMVLTVLMSLLASCVGDQGVAKNRGIVKDFSSTKPQIGCGENYLILTLGDTCTSECDTGTHIATSDELSAVIDELSKAPVTEAKTTLLTNINASAGICVDDVIVETRPTNQIDIKNDFCSCLNGKSDVINDCEATCASKPLTTVPTLYVNTLVGPDITLNDKLKNLNNWCKVQLQSDTTSPQCTLTATDGVNTVDNIPVITNSGSNSFNANIIGLAIDRTWILKLVESKSSQAQSKEFQLRRKAPALTDTTPIGALKVLPISQYSCLTFSATESSGSINIRSYVRLFYYFNEDPQPVPPLADNSALVVCHDAQANPGQDQFDYPRLELIPKAFSMWDRLDTRFVRPANTNKFVIETTLDSRLQSEYGITTTGQGISLFRLLSYPNRPTTVSTSQASINLPLGYIMIPFVDPNTQKSYCPTSIHFNGNQPLLNLLGDYMDDTEGLYLAEKEPEVVNEGGTNKLIYGTMFVREGTVKDYGFYVENGLKVKANTATLHSKTIYLYWPTSTTAEALTAGGRKMYTIRYPDTLNGNIPTGVLTSEPTTDKRIGCVPKS